MRILALHGNLGSVNDWDAVESALGCPIDRINLWEHSELALDQFAAAVLVPELQKLRASVVPEEKLLVVGYSLGGRLALPLLLQSDVESLLDSLILVSTHPGLTNDRERELRLGSDQNWAGRFRSAEPLEHILADWNDQAVFEADQLPECQLALASPYRHEIGQAFDNWSLGRQRDFRRALAEATIPVVMVAGEKDRKFADLGKQVAAVAPNLQFSLIKQVGHRILIRAPELLAQIMEQ